MNILNESINPDYLQPNTVNRLREEFRNNSPFPHLILQEFFNENLLLKVIEAMEEVEFFQKESDLFQFLQTLDLEDLQPKVLREFKELIASEEFISYMESITGLKLSRNTVDATGNLYSDTDYLLCHDDMVPGRKIAFIIYLSDLEEGQGGTLNLFDEVEGRPDKIVKKVIPKFNQLAFFEVLPHSFHEVEEVVGEHFRASITGWFYEGQ